jgi:hypothetical protein
MDSEISGMLSALTDLRMMLDAARMDMEDKAAAVITDEQRRQIAAIRAEYAVRIEEIEEQVKTYEEEIRHRVVANEGTVSGGRLQAVFMPGRVSWDNKALDALLDMHPWLLRHRKVGEPSVSIRGVK